MQGVAAVSGPAVVARDAQQVRLASASREFEAQMMKELLRPLTADTVPGSGDEDDRAGSTSVLGDFASEALARAIRDRGGFGIAARIAHGLSDSALQHGSAVSNDTVLARTKNPL